MLHKLAHLLKKAKLIFLLNSKAHQIAEILIKMVSALIVMINIHHS